MTLYLRSTAHNGYQWDEIVKSLFDIYLCGSDHIEDITSSCLVLVKPLTVTFKQRHYWARHQATGNRQYHIYGQEWKYIRIQHQRASERPTDETQHGRGLFKSGQFLDVDFDHQFIPTEKHDATYSYKKAFGSFPGVASGGGVIVHVENRDGNTPVKFCQAETLKRLFASLRKHGAVLPIPCRLRLLFERNRGNHRRAQQSVLSACVKLRERLYGICRAGRLENH